MEDSAPSPPEAWDAFFSDFYTATELVAMLARAGFEQSKCCGTLEGAPLGPDTRLVIAAVR